MIRYNFVNLVNFKKYVYETFYFGGEHTALIRGKNGVGKTTIFSAITWLFMDRDYEGHSNPNVATIGKEDDSTEVTLNLSIDGVEHELMKIQTRKVNGDRVSTTNSYKIDDVPYKKSDFFDKLDDLGVDIFKYDILTNINAFVGSRADEQRFLLLGLADEMNEVKIAHELGFLDLATELIKYCIGEIEAKEKQTIKSVEAKHGKKGILTNAKLDALKSLKAKTKNASFVKLIDTEIAELKELQISNEQLIADAERNLYQIEQIKNEMINRATDEINSHFKGVSFKLWEKQKDGQIKPCCKAIIDGYELGTSTNTAREFLAKVSIINGLSDFYNLNMPILIDGAEALDKDNLKAIKTNSQLLMAMVTNDKNLSIK